LEILSFLTLSVVDHHFDQFGDLVPREVTRI
jgi:hypothetical protein